MDISEIKLTLHIDQLDEFRHLDDKKYQEIVDIYKKMAVAEQTRSDAETFPGLMFITLPAFFLLCVCAFLLLGIMGLFPVALENAIMTGGEPILMTNVLAFVFVSLVFVGCWIPANFISRAFGRLFWKKKILSAYQNLVYCIQKYPDGGEEAQWFIALYNKPLFDSTKKWTRKLGARIPGGPLADLI